MCSGGGGGGESLDVLQQGGLSTDCEVLEQKHVLNNFD